MQIKVGSISSKLQLIHLLAFANWCMNARQKNELPEWFDRDKEYGLTDEIITVNRYHNKYMKALRRKDRPQFNDVDSKVGLAHAVSAY